MGKAEIIGTYTRGPIGVPYDHADNGKTRDVLGGAGATRGRSAASTPLPVSMTIAA